MVGWLLNLPVELFIYTSIDPPVNVYIDVDYPLFVDHCPNGSHWFSTLRHASIVGWVYKPTYIMQNLLILVLSWSELWKYLNLLCNMCMYNSYIYTHTFVCVYIYVYDIIYIYHLNMFIRESWGYLKLLMHWEYFTNLNYRPFFGINTESCLPLLTWSWDFGFVQKWGIPATATLPFWSAQR